MVNTQWMKVCQINSKVSNQSGIEMSNRLRLMKGSFYIWTGWGGFWMEESWDVSDMLNNGPEVVVEIAVI